MDFDSFLLSPNYFLDKDGQVAKMSIPALREFNAGMLIFRWANGLRLRVDGTA